MVVWTYQSMADEMVRATNSPSLPPLGGFVWFEGELDASRHSECTPGEPKAIVNQRSQNLVAILWIEDASTSNIVAAKALVNRSRASGKVGGEVSSSPMEKCPFGSHTSNVDYGS
jgi:sterol-4alpha-carboxylate 3-dehydrogenase (decarboxylating)